jgi:ComF family protein
MRPWLDFLFPPRADERIVRELAPGGLVGILRPVPVMRTLPETVALLPFSDSRVRAAVHEAKYHGSARALGLLSEALAAYLGARSGPRELLRLVPVPLGRERLRERGFNQAGEVARRAGGRLGIALDEALLERVRETGSQVSLARAQRHENVREAFKAARPAAPGIAYVLVDDVMTTGATMQAAIDALRAGGAEHILPVALAH